MAITDDRWDWLSYGIERGWVSKSFCHTHDGPPYTEEDVEYEDAYEEPPCIPCVRMWEEDQSPDPSAQQLTIADLLNIN